MKIDINTILLGVIASILIFRPGGGVENQGGTGEGGEASVQNYVGDSASEIRKRAEERGYFTSDDLSSLWGVSERTLYNYRQDGEIVPQPRVSPSGAFIYDLETRHIPKGD